MAIAMDPLFDQVLIVGESRPYLLAVIVLNKERWSEWLHAMGRDSEDDTLAKDHDIHAHLLRRISKQLAPFPGYAKVRRIIPTFRPWSVKDGLITPTLKPRRKKISALFAKEIKALYKR